MDARVTGGATQRSEAPTVPDEGSRETSRVALAAGATIEERYVVLARAGQGGMGEVYAAYDRKLDRKVALKMLLRDDSHDKTRLMREAQAMARLAHPNIVAVFDTGTFEDRLFLSMEFVQGTTLRAWQKAAERDWRDVLKVYLEAGAGLAAAHAAGLVHRDFKPANVLVSDSGAVKVTDFGLARAVGEPARRRAAVAETSDVPEATPSGPSLDTTMTGEGTLLGTPGYMAPEQILGLATDERGDQFAFCVALYEALYGHKPFAGESEAERNESVVAGRIREPPRSSRVPMHVRRALERGLSVDRSSRHDSIRALLGELSLDPSRKRRRILLAAGLVAVVGGSTAWAVRASTARQAQLCSGAEHESAEVWGPGVQQRVEQALLATGVPYAADTWQRTQQNIDAYLDRWRAMYQQTCEATRLRGEQSEAVMTARMACLERRRQEVEALGRVLSDADRDVASKAIPASMALTSVEVCRDVPALMAVEPEPGDALAHTELSSIRAGLANAKANLDAGRFRRALDELDPLVGRARALGYAPVTAQALLLSTWAKGNTGKPAEAIADGQAAAFDADRGHDDAVRLAAETELVLLYLRVGQPDAAEVWSRAADGTLGRTGDLGEPRALWLYATGRLMVQAGKPGEAVERLTEALEVARRARSGAFLMDRIAPYLAGALGEIGRYDEAMRILDEQDQALVRAAGPDHPFRVGVLHVRSGVAAASNDAAGELAYARAAIELALRVAPDDAQLVSVYNNACDALVHLERYEEALDECSEAIAQGQRLNGPRGNAQAIPLITSGEALMGLHRPAEAAAYYQKVIDRSDAAHPWYLELALSGLGEALLGDGRPRQAIAPLERALAMDAELQLSDAEHELYVAEARFALAQALWQTGVRGARIAELISASANAFRRRGHESRAAEAESWLSAQRQFRDRARLP